MDSSPQGASADSSNPSKIVLYSFWKSSCCWRVRFALNLKECWWIEDIVKELGFGGLDVELLQFFMYHWFLGLSYEYRSVNLAKGEQFSPEFERLNPLKYVPVLVDGDVVLSDSFAILLYLEEKYHQKPLLPADPQLRALNLQAASVVTSSIQPLIMLDLLKSIEEKVGPEKQQLWAQSTIEKGFSALEKLLKKFAGTYSTGEELNMADVFLAPQIAIAINQFKIDMSKFPLLGRMFESYKTLPEFQASQPDRQPDALRQS